MSHPFTRPMLATEHSEYDRGAEALGFALARRCGVPLAGVLPIVSNPEYEMVAPQLAAQAEAQAAGRRSALEAAARAQGVELDLRMRRGPEAFAEIVAEARERSIDLIVIRRRGRRGLLANLLVGEMVSKVVAHAPCSVLVVPRDAAMWQRRVLLALDPRAPDSGSLGQAVAVAAECGLPLHVVSVVADAAARATAEQSMAGVLSQVRLRYPASDGEVRVGRPHEAVIAAARAVGADLIVVSRHGGTELARAWIGGTAQKVIGLAEGPVLVHVPNPSKAQT